MDNICHTLVGVAAARAGLKHKTAFATTTLAIASNLPDIDVFALATGIPAVALRRGWTHGVLAQVLLPGAFAAVMYAIARRKHLAEARPDHMPPGRAKADFTWLLILSYLGVLAHVFLDYLNTYGIRLLMPFSSRWFYGDAVFIVDPWLWLSLGLGSLAAVRGRRWPAVVGLTVATVYIAGMLVSARAARQVVLDRWTETMGTPPAGLMVGPAPITPFRKNIIVDAGDRFVTGTFSWYPRHIAFNREEIPKNDAVPWTAMARRQEPDFNHVLVWSRFPYWTFEERADGVRVTLRDVRFPIGRAAFGVQTVVPR